ncbi:MAG: carboxymuconolactone decarboxylase family protein [Pyrinomonadaceae bacterium]|nr:carboxymuconolactone decarboxylase family protein [Pyrinomonadaceae bacterium]
MAEKLKQLGVTDEDAAGNRRATENGVTEAELIETITHLAFYSGWPKAMSAITIANEVFKKQ